VPQDARLFHDHDPGGETNETEQAPQLSPRSQQTVEELKGLNCKNATIRHLQVGGT